MVLAERRPRLTFVGPMLGRYPGWVPNPAEPLSEHFAGEGYSARLTSTRIRPLPRLADMLVKILLWRRWTDLYVVAVYSHDAFRMADIPSRWIRLLGGRQVFVLHGGNLPKFSDKHPRWVRKVLDRADAIVSPSAFLADFYCRWGYDTRVIPNLLQVERYPFRQRDAVQPRLIWMRTFSDLYNPGMALQALERVRRELPTACLTMAGQDRGLRAVMQQQAGDMGLNGAVDFPGFLEFDAKQRLFAAHDIYLHTNRVDNTPVSVLEAGAFGLPVVATSVGGLPFLLEHERSGLLVEDGDAEAMAASVVRLVREPALAARLSVEGRALAERAAWPEVFRQWQEVFADLGFG